MEGERSKVWSKIMRLRKNMLDREREKEEGNDFKSKTKRTGEGKR